MDRFVKSRGCSSIHWDKNKILLGGISLDAMIPKEIPRKRLSSFAVLSVAECSVSGRRRSSIATKRCLALAMALCTAFMLFPSERALASSCHLSSKRIVGILMNAIFSRRFRARELSSFVCSLSCSKQRDS